MTSSPALPARRSLFAAVIASGAGGLVWELLWQQRAALALGVSAFGAAITLASMMAGFALGAALVARLATRRGELDAMRGYGLCELVVAVGGLVVAPGLAVVGALDARLWASAPALAWTAQLGGTALLLMVPSIAMGATVPLLAACAGPARTSIALLYGLNTAGAVLGILGATFVFIPALGLRGTTLLTAAIDLLVALWALRQPPIRLGAAAPEPSSPSSSSTLGARGLLLAAASGLAIFALEVAWFRSVRAIFQSTTDSFGVLLGAFLVPLSLAASVAAALRRRWPGALAGVLVAAGVLAAVTAPALRLLSTAAYPGALWLVPLWRFLHVLVLIGPAVFLLGLSLPWLLDAAGGAARAGALYASNTIGAVLGALGAGFVLLPAVGALRATWIAGALMVAAALLAQRGVRGRLIVLALGTAGLALAVRLDDGAGRSRVEGAESARWGRPLFVAEGPDVTVTVAEEAGGGRDLIIDGFEASSDSKDSHYMRWMGHLPALAAGGDPHDALVICFGTGQTTHAVRRHAPAALDVVDVSAAVLRAAPLFAAVNERVLEDARVHPVVMDGRAFLRRARDRRYDVVTLEPMPPNFAGVNNLYSREFYQLVRARLRPGGAAAQWVPFHLVAPDHVLAIIATFHEAFPHAILWVDPVEGTGILVGADRPFSLARARITLDLDDAAIRGGVLLDDRTLPAIAALGDIVTDDNQLLAYGLERLTRYRFLSADGAQALSDTNRATLKKLADAAARGR